jgi:hypothetical protein
VTRRCLFACIAAGLVFIPHAASAQFTDPRNYQNTAVGTNQLELSYTYAHADASIDTSVPIAGAHLNLNGGTVDYTRYFGVLHRLMWAEAAIPVAVLDGSLGGTNIHSSTSGAGDSNYAVAMLLKGGPALSFEKFRDYTPTTTLGISVTITAPTGAYNADRILNLGADRWSFKPEIGLSYPFGSDQKWEIDAYANTYFYTNNSAYHGREILRQEPLAGFEGHLSYAFADSVWLAFDTRYSFRGSTVIDGVPQDNPQQNFIVGSELNIGLSASSSLVVEVAKAVVHVNGPAVVGVSVKYDYTWGKSQE